MFDATINYKAAATYAPPGMGRALKGHATKYLKCTKKINSLSKYSMKQFVFSKSKFPSHLFVHDKKENRMAVTVLSTIRSNMSVYISIRILVYKSEQSVHESTSDIREKT